MVGSRDFPRLQKQKPFTLRVAAAIMLNPPIKQKGAREGLEITGNKVAAFGLRLFGAVPTIPGGATLASARSARRAGSRMTSWKR